MVLLQDHAVADDIRQLRNHGSKGAYKHERVGFNSRLDEMQAGILLVKFKRIDQYNEKRRKRAALYNELLSDEYNTACGEARDEACVSPVYDQELQKRRDTEGPA